MFVNLNVRSHYSLLLSALSLQDIIDFAVVNEQKYVVLTDVNVLYGAIDFFDLAKRNNLIPVIGLEIFHQLTSSNLVLIAKSNAGYVNLLKISSLIATDEPFDLNDYLTDIAVILKDGSFQPHDKKVEFYLGDGSADDNAIALNEVSCKNKEEAYLINVLQAIKNEQVFDSESQVYTLNEEAWFITEQEAKKRFNKTQLNNLEKLLNNIKWDVNEFHTELLKYPVPKKIAPNIYLQALCKEGLKQRFHNSNVPKVYVERLKHELNVIDQMGFNDYFLIVYDFVNFAKSEKIVVGPGRGSVVGSLVAYALHITDVDPIKYNLLFERFLNFERKTMPDIDIDIMDTRRDEIIDYLFSKYGKNHVAHIITFQRIKAKMAIRDVGRILKIDLQEIDSISKLIDSKHDENLNEAINNSTKLAKKAKEYPLLFEIANKIINIPRQVGTHAAGVVLSNVNLTDIIAVQRGINNRLMSQFSMEHLDRFGLLKMDLLGLKNLTILDNILHLINRDQKNKLSLNQIRVDDARTFNLFAAGDTNGIFQFESHGMKRTLRMMVPKTLEDLSLVSSLFRPGPQENIPTFIKRRKKEEPIEYVSKSLEPILKDTNGIIVYQEQVIQMVQAVANFTADQADIFRRAISKKDDSKMKELKIEFINKAITNNYKETDAEKIYDYIYHFANYGFNHSHAIAYSLIGYWLAYFKVNYPLEFYTTLLQANSGSSEKISTYTSEAISKGIHFNLPDINASAETFNIINQKIYFGFNSIKGVGSESIKKIIEARNCMPLQRFESFVEAVGQLSKFKINAKMLESLIYAGAFDNFGLNRKTLITNLSDVLSIAAFDPEASDQYKLQDEVMSPTDYEEYKKLQEKTIAVNFENDTRTSVLKSIREKLMVAWNLKTLNAINSGEHIYANCLSIISKFKVITTKTGKQMAFLTIKDDTGVCDKIIAWAGQYEKYKDIIKNDLVTIMSIKTDEKGMVLLKILAYYNEEAKQVITL